MGCCVTRESEAFGSKSVDTEQCIKRDYVRLEPRLSDVGDDVKSLSNSPSGLAAPAAKDRVKEGQTIQESTVQCSHRRRSGLAACFATLCGAAVAFTAVLMLEDAFTILLLAALIGALLVLATLAGVLAGMLVYFRFWDRSDIDTKVPSNAEERHCSPDLADIPKKVSTSDSADAKVCTPRAKVGACSKSALSSAPVQLTEACERAAKTLILADILEVLEDTKPILSHLPGCTALKVIYDSQVANVRASPDLSCTVREALERESSRGAHRDFNPKGQMNPKSVGCELYWTILALRWAAKTMEGVRDDLRVGVAAGNAYLDTFEPHHGFWLRQAFRSAFSLASNADPAPVKQQVEGLQIPTVSILCEKLEACYDEVGLFDKRRV